MNQSRDPFVGGPLDGTTREVPDNRPPWIMVTDQGRQHFYVYDPDRQAWVHLEEEDL